MCRISYCGELLLKELLKNKVIIVQRLQLRNNIHRVDEAGVSSRKTGKFKGRVYNVKAPNELWHIDTNHRLRWCMIIFGAVDGFSRLPVSLERVRNNKSETLLSYFMKGLQMYGIPSQERSDKGKENVLIKRKCTKKMY